MFPSKLSLKICALCFVMILTATDAAARGPQSLRLVAVHTANFGNPLAIIEDTNSKQQDVFTINAKVFSKGKVKQIAVQHVVLEYNGEEFAIGFKKGVRIEPHSNVKDTMHLSTPTTDIAFAKERVSASSTAIKIKKEELKSIWKELPQTIDAAKPRFVTEQGKVLGLGFFAIAEESLLSKIGLENGDILKTINGQQITSPRHALQLLKYSTSPDTTGTHIVITRNGSEQLIVVGSI